MNVIRIDYSATIGDGFMMAPYAEIRLGENSRLVIEDNYWMCVAARMYVPPDTTVHVGYGAVLPPCVVASTDIPGNTIFFGDNKFREIEPEQSFIPDEWIDPKWIREKLNVILSK